MQMISPSVGIKNESNTQRCREISSQAKPSWHLRLGSKTWIQRVINLDCEDEKAWFVEAHRSTVRSRNHTRDHFQQVKLRHKESQAVEHVPLPQELPKCPAFRKKGLDSQDRSRPSSLKHLSSTWSTGSIHCVPGAPWAAKSGTSPTQWSLRLRLVPGPKAQQRFQWLQLWTKKRKR